MYIYIYMTLYMCIYIFFMFLLIRTLLQNHSIKGSRALNEPLALRWTISPEHMYIYVYICAPIARCLSPDDQAPQSPATHRHPEWPSGQIWPNPFK